MQKMNNLTRYAKNDIYVKSALYFKCLKCYVNKLLFLGKFVYSYVLTLDLEYKLSFSIFCALVMTNEWLYVGKQGSECLIYLPPNNGIFAWISIYNL